MGSKLSSLGSSIVHGVKTVGKAIPSVLKAVPGIAESALQGGLAGSAGFAGGPELGIPTTIVGALAGAIPKAISDVSDIVKSSGEASQSPELTANGVSDVLDHGAKAVSAVSNLRHLLPVQHQKQLHDVIQSHAQGALGTHVASLGKMAKVASQGILNHVYGGANSPTGGVAPDALEKYASPVRNEAGSLIPSAVKKDLDGQRKVAFASNLQPQASPILVSA